VETVDSPGQIASWQLNCTNDLCHFWWWKTPWSWRIFRPTDSPPLGTIRCLAYVLPVIEEVLNLEVDQDYFRYLRYKLARFAQTQAVP
jgi:hypothetical protein